MLLLGASVMGEIDRVGRRLRGKAGNDAAWFTWFTEWTRMADRLRRLGLDAERRGHRLTAAAFFKRACLSYQMGERFRTPKDMGSKDKALKVFTAEEGGAQHCQMDNVPLGVHFIGDWLKEKLRA